MENPTSPQIALGTMYFGTRQSRDEAFPILDRFVDLGGTWLDTADNYAFWRDDTGFGGASERMLGDWLAANPGTRELVLISTKVGADPLVAGSWPESMEGLAPAVIDGALTRSLERLGTDHQVERPKDGDRHHTDARKLHMIPCHVLGIARTQWRAVCALVAR